MSKQTKRRDKPIQWRVEILAHWILERTARLLPAALVFRLGERLGGGLWKVMAIRRRQVIRNIRIAFSGQMPIQELQGFARQSFCRSAGNMVASAHAAGLPLERIGEVFRIENPEVLERSHAQGRGTVLLLAHMGNWEILTRMAPLFPQGSKLGAYYRPLNNPIMNARIVRSREADSCRLFSKSDSPHQAASFLRQNGILGILADQRVGKHGELIPFFGRLTRASPLPSLLARRCKSEVIALSMRSDGPGKWVARLHEVDRPYSTASCMAAIETSMRDSPIDVFWLQERWKIYPTRGHGVTKWFGDTDLRSEKRHRALLWLPDAESNWTQDPAWLHPDIGYELILRNDQEDAGLEGLPVHRIKPEETDGQALLELLTRLEDSSLVPIDFILTPRRSPALERVARRLAIPVHQPA